MYHASVTETTKIKAREAVICHKLPSNTTEPKHSNKNIESEQTVLHDPYDPNWDSHQICKIEEDNIGCTNSYKYFC